MSIRNLIAWLIVATFLTFLVMCSGPAHASNDNGNNGNNGNGNKGSSQSDATANSTAIAGAAALAGSVATASGGTAVAAGGNAVAAGGSGGLGGLGGAGGTGGLGGTATSTAAGGAGGLGGGGGSGGLGGQGGVGQGGNATGASSSVSVTNNGARAAYAPDVLATPTAPCRVAIGGSVGWLGGALGISTSTLDEGCDVRESSRHLYNVGLKEAAVQVLCLHEASRKALEITGTKCLLGAAPKPSNFD